MLNPQGRPTRAVSSEATGAPKTISGDRGLDHDEKLIFEIGRTDVTGVDLPDVVLTEDRLGGLKRKSIGLPGLSEPETLRHYVRLSQRNASIDASLYPLGSCTMKHNPRLNEKLARLPGFADIHPLQPQKTVQGAFTVIAELARWLTELTGMPVNSVSQRARPARKANCAVSSPFAPRLKRAGNRESASWFPNPRTAPIPPRRRSPASLPRTSERGPMAASISRHFARSLDRTLPL